LLIATTQISRYFLEKLAMAQPPDLPSAHIESLDSICDTRIVDLRRMYKYRVTIDSILLFRNVLTLELEPLIDILLRDGSWSCKLGNEWLLYLWVSVCELPKSDNPNEEGGYFTSFRLSLRAVPTADDYYDANNLWSRNVEWEISMKKGDISFSCPKMVESKELNI
jgi:hypothetical protein